MKGKMNMGNLGSKVKLDGTGIENVTMLAKMGNDAGYIALHGLPHAHRYEVSPIIVRRNADQT